MTDAPTSGAARFIGQRVPRKEDRRLLTGRGQFTDDAARPGTLECAFVRSPVARAKILKIDTAAARALPGVRAVFTAEDLKRRPHRIICMLTTPQPTDPKVTTLAEGLVKYVGDPVALVVADDRYIAEDAAALVEVEYESEQPVVTPTDAKTGLVVHPEVGSNLACRNATPPDPELDAAFANAAHVVTRTIRHQRQTHSPMEPRGIMASLQGAGDLTVHVSCQSPQMAARFIAEMFQIPDQNVRVIAKDVGGAFGQKVQLWREEVAVVAAALLLGRPVKWIEDRLENLTAATHAREQEVTVKMAFDAEGRWLAAHADFEGNLGAYPHMIEANVMGMMMIPGPYRLGRYGYDAEAYFTNTCGQGAYRGPWMMEALARETMLDVAARQMGMDAIELRRRNLVRKKDQPYAMFNGWVMERVTPLETLDLALEKIDVAAFRAEQAAARAQGRYLGLGVAVYVEPTTMGAPGPMVSETAHIRVNPDGKVVVMSSTHSQGHGTETTIAQVVAEQLGVDISDVTVFEDDSSRGGFGMGAGGSRQAVAGGGSAGIAAAKVREKIQRIAAHLLNAPAEDVLVERGAITVRGVTEVTSTVREIAETAYFRPDRLPPDMDLGLEVQHRYRTPPVVFSNAAHACIVEVDRETGVTKILRWVASEDCGVMINPAIVEGQIAGGVVQGIGGVLMEHASYDASGNPTAVTFKDYLLPTLHDVPVIEYCHIETPSTTPGGFKGVGEGGAIIAPPTLVNAINDALSPFGVTCLDLPLSPERLFEAMESAKSERA